MTARLLFFLVLVLFASELAYAKKSTKPTTDSQGYDLVFKPKLLDGSVIIDSDNTPPREPNIIEIKFLKDNPPRGMLERISRLIQGIDTDIPPEYDIYGYEIRRYMAQAGNPKIYTDEDFLIQQIKNVRKARVIITFWQKHLESEIDDIKKQINEEDSSSLMWTSLKQNRQQTRSFIIAAQSWLDSNERFLMNVLDIQSNIQLEYPEIIFMRAHERIEFYNLLQIRQVKLEQIKKYQPFAMMAY